MGRNHILKWSFFVICVFICHGVAGQDNFYYGAAYYPEQITDRQVEKDALLMKQAGFNLMRMGDFAWSSMEPSEGQFTLDWLQHAVETLDKQGIFSLLCTPTAAIPKWMYDRYPDVMQVQANGIRKEYGRRRHACLNNEHYRKFAERIATQLALRFVNNKSVIGFQIDNELMAEEPYCYCSTCRKKFAHWLKRKYQHVERLNEAWNLSFWSQNIKTFEEVYLPRSGDNPSCFQDYLEFYSDCAIDFFCLQRDAIKKVSQRFKVTHNICSSGFLYRLDLYKLADKADFMSIDNYPIAWTLENEYGNTGSFVYTPTMASLALSQIRGTNNQLPFMVTEAQIARTAGRQRHLVSPGMVRLWSHQEVAHGANGIVFFPYKAFKAGHEHVMSGVIDVDDKPRRRYSEVSETGSEIRKILNLTGELTPTASVAVIRDFHADWAFENKLFSSDFRYMRQVHSYYNALREEGMTVDIISPEDNFLKYKLIVVPSLVLMDEKLALRLEEAVKKGVSLVITGMSGLRDMQVQSYGTLVNKRLERLAGIEIGEQHALLGEKSIGIKWGNSPEKYSSGYWFDVFSLTSASPLASYDENFFKGNVAVSSRVDKSGASVYYVGTIAERELTAKIIQTVLAQQGIRPLAISENKMVEITEVKGKSRYLYLINFSEQSANVYIEGTMMDILSKEKYNKEIIMAPMDIKVVEINR